MMNLKELLKEMFDNYPDCYKDYGLAIMDRYEIEVEKKKLTPEEIDNLTHLYFNNMSYIEIMAINKMHLEDKIKKLEEELAEKDRKIEWLQINLINKKHEFTKLQDKELFKEDFEVGFESVCYFEDFHNVPNEECKLEEENHYLLKDNSKYDKLPRKEDK